ncbi:WYL domain-containing protein [Enterobacteriaceae bacterium H18W14]|uniref:helix-turn-helix transcriptional regulator n=1 Tax=Dryocola boscaweniae TaxID=2925397 RepID=UPI0022F09E30|nr:WYL domain-containing protein [Dryocola boscaweniae]MCT4715260.1 WYL domain-containing protein [Dryocola boscaweniae]
MDALLQRQEPMRMKGAKVKVADRLAEIVLSLYQGETFSADIIRQRFDVDMRTAYRDLNRLGAILEDIGEGKKRLSSHLKGPFNVNDLLRLTKRAGLAAVYPWNDIKTYRQFIHLRSIPDLLVLGYEYENSPQLNSHFYELNNLINSRRYCRFIYKNALRCVAPYRLATRQGIWYLLGTEDNHADTWMLSQINSLESLTETFIPDSAVLTRFDNEEGLDDDLVKTEVLLQVSAQAAVYFKRRKLLPFQQMMQELDNGCLILSSHIVSPEQLFPLVQYWIPHVTIISPQVWQHDLKARIAAWCDIEQ